MGERLRHLGLAGKFGRIEPYAVCGRPAENVIAEEYGRRE